MILAKDEFGDFDLVVFNVIWRVIWYICLPHNTMCLLLLSVLSSRVSWACCLRHPGYITTGARFCNIWMTDTFNLKAPQCKLAHVL